MLKIKNERAWVVQAVFDPIEDICIKCAWVGSLEATKATSAKILANASYTNPPTIEFGNEQESYFLTFPRQGRQNPRKRLHSNFFMTGIVCVDLMEDVVSGHGDVLYDQVFAVLKQRCEVPLLREWMPTIFEAGLVSGDIIRLQTVGMDVPANRQPAYHIKMQTTAIKDLLLRHFQILADQAAQVVQANAA